jgi:cyclic beta-1,2-glucan synthetase
LIKAFDRAQAVLSDADQPLIAAHQLEQKCCTDIDSAFLRALDENPTRWSAEEIAHFRENDKVFRQRIRMILDDIELFAPWSERLSTPPALLSSPEYQASYNTLYNLLSVLQNANELPRRFQTAVDLIADWLTNLTVATSNDRIDDAKAWLETLQHDISNALAAIDTLDRSRKTLVQITANLIKETDFRFLYDSTRNLFRVGYNASTGEADSSYYDLLASEARLASFVAIANGDIPAKHWMFLGRPLTRIRGLRVLLSWSATAFEYLMPRLVLHSPPNGLLNQSCEGAVKEQIRFGRKYGIPWGVSESGYAQFDQYNHYQYFAFGIPKLGLKWDQGERLVVSSYSSALALAYAPTETLRNLRQLIRLGASAHYGLYEALDFGEAHRPRPERPRIVQSYMAHHQGMILVAFGNVLHQDQMPRRFHRDSRIATVEYLLYEQLPQRMQTRPLERLPSPLKELPAAPATVSEWSVDPTLPEVALLSNGRLSSRVSSHGAGGLYWRGMAATRWDPLAEGSTGGTRLYLKDLDNDRLRCLGGERLPEDVETLFAPHMVEFRARRKELLLRVTIMVAPATDTEIRRITIANDGPTTRHVMLSSYSEPVLGPERADRRHHSFSKLFVESQHLEEDGTLLFRRRPREPDQTPMYLAHSAVTQPGRNIAREFEVDRGAFLGRNADLMTPTALIDPSYPFSPTARGNVDPCAAITLTLDIPPRSTVQCAFLTAVAASRSDAIDALQPFRSLERIDWTVEATRLQSERELTDMRVDSDTVQASFILLAKVLWPRTVPHIDRHAFDTVHQVQGVLWQHGISGDRPIITLSIDSDEDLEAAEVLLKNVRYLSRKAFAIDVVFLDETKGGYTFPTNDRLRRLIETQLPAGRERDGALAFVVPVSNMSASERSELIAASRVFIDPQNYLPGKTLIATGLQPIAMPAFVPQPSAPLSHSVIAPVALRNNLLWTNRYGGMLPDSSAYSLLIANDSRTPAPWCNVLANPDFGTLVSEAGSMCTWWGNSSENRLTPWNNDPVLDRTGEAIYVRDEETGESWSMTPQSRSDDTPYRVTHAIGESLFEHNRHGLEQRLQVFVDPEHPVKFLRIRLSNKWPRARRLTVTFAVEWLLGNAHSYEQHLLLPERDAESGALLVRNGFVRHTGEVMAFVGSGLAAHGVTCDGNEFFGQERSWAAPIGLAAVGLSDRVAPNAYPCAIYQVHIDMPVDATRDLHFVLGAAENRSAATELINKSCRPDWVDERYRALGRQWDDLLNAWSVETPDTAADAMINRWLLYQVISSRLWGRIGFYQASGGFGFRDQLQDVLALLDTKPELAREQILLAASRQFEQGDVLHWWHESPLRGVRSRISDDLLWLPYAVAEYADVTDDASILQDTAPFLLGQTLGEHELERYAEYQNSAHEASLYDHCCRAIDARTLFGVHGLPLIGTGDWNDGLNRVGEEGRGESVWMAWFLILVCRRFAPLCRQQNDQGRAEHYEDIANDLLQHTQKTAWAGDWYLRGYFDDGTPLGAPGDTECEIDLNTQTWAVLADPDDPAARQAMQAAEEKLFDAEHRLIKLLAPPFEKTPHDPGYIRSYPPGVRENGGQYTHAAAWAPWAAVMLGEKDKAMRWFEWLNPLKRAVTDADIERYRLEPYVTPGDIYGVGALAGRGGWSWYTGSAAWLYRFAVRQLLGLQRYGDRLYVRPCLPDTWPVFAATLRREKALYRLQVHEPSHIRNDELFIVEDGAAVDASFITLEGTASHTFDIFASDAARRSWLAQQPSSGNPDSGRTPPRHHTG